jgi:hypothetical protein
MKKKSNTNLSETSVIKARSAEAATLERDRLAIVKDIEKLMKRYAKITGDSNLAKRKYRVGKAPNDFSEK